MPVNRSARPAILVTGAHRSGTSWVGRMLAASPAVAYIHEPFNLTHDPGFCAANFETWFTYITVANEAPFYDPIARTLAFRYNLPGKLKSIGRPGDLVDGARDSLKFWSYRRGRARPLLKDPIAVLSAGWLAARFDMQVVMIIRHPAAFAGSVKVKNWSHPFSDFLEQPLLMRDYLEPFTAEIAKFAAEEQPIVDQAALLWKLIYYIVSAYRQKHPEWIFLRHEDLSGDPMGGFEALYERLGLTFGPAERLFVEKHSFPERFSGAAGRTGYDDVQRNSAANIRNWEKRLTPAEVGRVRVLVEPVSGHFYSDDEW